MKIVGQMVLGPGEADRHLKTTLDAFKRLTDDVIVATCNAGRKEISMLDFYDFRHYEDNREWGRYQPDIKTRLLKHILTLGADWILPLDADEEMLITRLELESLVTPRRESAYFYIVNLWNDEKHYQKGLSFWNVRFYQADSSKGVKFLRRPVHCGNAPPYFYRRPAEVSYVPYIVLHRGLLDKSDRQRKSERYDIYDPHAVCKGRDYYDALRMERDGQPLDLTELKTNLEQYVSTIKHAP